MDRKGRIYEPPRAKIYRFDDNDQILTASGEPSSAPDPVPNYAANALNELFGGTNTTIE